MQMGLHRDPKHFKKMGVLEGELRRRLWATILELDVQAALDAGVPPTLSLDDFDTEAPSNVNDKDIDEQTEALQEHPATTTTDSSLQRFLIQSLRPRLEVAHRMNGITSSLSDVSYNELMSLDAAMAILSPVPKNAEFAHLVLHGAGMFKNRMIHASLAVASELLMEVEEQGPVEYDSSSQEPSGYRKMLMEALREALRQSAQRIRLGETNVKLHMKLSMAMRQTEVAGDHSSSLQHLAQAAKESLETSYATIQERAICEGVDVESGGNGGMSEDFDPDDFDPENFSLGSNFNLDDLFLLPTDFVTDGVPGLPQVQE
ncbi:hypothetical protein H2202_001537 [Exophiala xenobiotica]|nr:hypothetical protein H2202_001537 [Exophiala xenobiotica]